MARIRSIKPEFWVSEQLAECSTNARLTFIGLWTFSDDRGVHPAKPKTLKALVYPMDDVSPTDVAAWVDELIRAGLVIVFEADGEVYWHVTGWAKHQKIDRPSFKHPAPPPFDEHSTNARRQVAEGSLTVRRALPPGVERSGEEGSGAEVSDSLSESPRRRRKADDPAQHRTPTIPCPYDQIVERYHEALPTLPRVQLVTADRQKALRKRWAWVLSSSRADGARRAETAEQALDWFRDFFARAAANGFVTGAEGRAGEHAGWQCTLDYLLTDKGLRQVVELTRAA